MNASDYLAQLQTLTKKNLEILTAINDSFYTKNEHISASVDGKTYVVPSFLSLENKINALQDSFNNLVNVPSTGEAYFNFDGSSQVIEMRGFNCAPDKLSLTPPTTYSTKSNDIFKDFLSPCPYVNFDLTSIPDDITTVNVKKVAPISSELIDRFKDFLGDKVSISKSWADVYKILQNYTEDVDYVEYDTVMSLPARQPVGSAQYVISSVVGDEVDDNLDEIITLKLRSDFSGVSGGSNYTGTLTYKLFDETIEKNLRVGDYLVTYNNSTKLEIIEVRPLTNTIIVKVLNGEYLNLVESNGDNIQDLSVLKFFSEANLNDTKYVQVPLEEDQYIFVAVAALNNRLRVQAPWGDGVIINTYELLKDDEKFYTYYTNNVKNIGDVLYEITSMMSNTLMKYSSDEYSVMTSIKPVIDIDIDKTSNLQVVQINKHLDDSESVKNIRTLYSQKKQYSTELTSIQTDIDRINEELSSISFDDTTGQRSALTASLSSNNKRKNELTTSLAKIMDDIASAANNSEIPLENAKYRIRGYYGYNELINRLDIVKDHIKGIDVWYRYKNVDKETGNALSIDDNFVFSDWVKMNSFDLDRISSYSDGTYKFSLETPNDKKNEPSFNQIDIPISQGETVDIRLRVLYDFGTPFVKVYSAWSDIINIAFPEEYTKDVQILDIISENNNDIETNRFTNILAGEGIPDHVGDSIQDQDITYYHKPENISSGFYTSERRIIPLKDKLTELDNYIQILRDEVEGTNSSALKVTAEIGQTSTTLTENTTNVISLAGYDEIVSDNSVDSDGSYIVDGNKVTTIMNLKITNSSSHTIKLYPVFPGPRAHNINTYTYKPITGYVDSDTDEGRGGVWIMKQNQNDAEEQSCNQFITFRINDVWTGQMYYADLSTTRNYTGSSLASNLDDIIPKDNNTAGMWIYPLVNSTFSLCTDSDATNSYYILNADESVVVPISIIYNMNAADEGTSITKTMSFDVRTSLYQDPINYTFSINAKKIVTPQDKILRKVTRKLGNKTELVKYKATI